MPELILYPSNSEMYDRYVELQNLSDNCYKSEDYKAAEEYQIEADRAYNNWHSMYAPNYYEQDY